MDKTCAQCAETKPVETGFYRSKKNSDGRDSYCKACRDGRHAAHVAKQRASRPVVVPPTEKECSKCGEVKKLSEFYVQGRGRRADCKPCRDAYHVEYSSRPDVAARLAQQRQNRASGKWKRPPRRQPHAEGFEVCTMCNEDKPLEQFHDHKLGRNGKDSVCRSCKSIMSRERNKDPKVQERMHRTKGQRVFGLKPGQYDEMLAAQDGACYLCKRIRPDNRRLHVDHCHETGQVRKLLCNTCNTGLGAFRDDVDLLLAAAQYILDHRVPSVQT